MGRENYRFAKHWHLRPAQTAGGTSMHGRPRSELPGATSIFALMASCPSMLRAQPTIPNTTNVSDPANPVPYRRRPISPTYPGGGWPTWLVEDQRFVDHRPDVLTWETKPLTRDIVAVGDIVAQLFASTSGTDSDWIVKLIDVYPERYDADQKMGGYELMIADEVFRGRFRESFELPRAIAPNRAVHYTIDLHTNDHAFLRGHRIMVQVQSTWFSRDRPQSAEVRAQHF
jgi:predicted acyl esterase